MSEKTLKNKNSTNTSSPNTSSQDDTDGQRELRWLLDEATKWHPHKLMPAIPALKNESDQNNLSSLFWSRQNPEQDEHLKAQLQLVTYLEDLRTVLQLPNGAGERVLRRWLGAAWDGYPLSLGSLGNLGNLGANDSASAQASTALLNYCLERRAEIALADPVALARLTLQEARQISLEFLQEPTTSHV